MNRRTTILRFLNDLKLFISVANLLNSFIFDKTIHYTIQKFDSSLMSISQRTKIINFEGNLTLYLP